MPRISQYPYSQLTEYLEAMIASGQFQSGSKLPSLRELSAQFNLNLDTARRGIWALRDKGLVECRRNTGVFVAEQRRMVDGEYRIAVYLWSINLNETFSAHVFAGVQEEAARKNVTLELHANYNTVGKGSLGEDLMRHLQSCDAAILLGSYDRDLEELPRMCPVVGVEMHRSYCDLASVLSLDPVRAAELAADFFRRRKIREVTVFSENFPLHIFRADLFASQWRGRGERVEIRELGDLQTIDPSIFSDSGRGCLFTGGEACNWSGKCYAKHYGKPFTAERCVLSIDGKSRLLPGYLPVNTIDINWNCAGKMALQEAIRRIVEPGCPAQRIYVAPDLHEIKNETIEPFSQNIKKGDF